jgi:glycosyltransferase involved in cell wall biosynthesis
MSDFELIIINDGSADSSGNIISSYNDPRIVLITNPENKGLIYSLNKGLSTVRGKYIARMDADDISMKNRLQVQCDYLDHHSSTGIIGSSMRFFGDMERLRKSVADNETLKAAILFKNPFHHPAVMFRSSLLKDFNLEYENGFYLAEDYALWIRMFFVTEFANITEPLVHYRMHTNQETKKDLSRMEVSILKAQKIIYLELGIDLNETEEKVSTLIYTGAYECNKKFADDVAAWLLKLHEKNKLKNVFSRKHFDLTLGKTWFLICTSLASKKIKTNKIYFQSPLHTFYDPGFMEKTKFRIKNSILTKL